MFVIRDGWHPAVPLIERFEREDEAQEAARFLNESQNMLLVGSATVLYQGTPRYFVDDNDEEGNGMAGEAGILSDPPVLTLTKERTHCEACKEELKPNVAHECHGNKHHNRDPHWADELRKPK